MSKDPLDAIESALNSINTGLTQVSGSGNERIITYPFLFIDSVSEVEMKYLQHLPDGDTPLMVKAGKGYALIKNTTMSLKTIKHLSRFKDRDIWVKESKETIHPIEKIIDMLLLEEE